MLHMNRADHLVMLRSHGERLRSQLPGNSGYTLNRAVKRDYFDIIGYEIDMLRYAFARLWPEQPTDIRDTNVFLESYLVHYRGLLEFFAKPYKGEPYPNGEKAKRNPKDTDLHVRRTAQWANGAAVAQGAIEAVVALASPIYNELFLLISQQLSHCTQARKDAEYEWQVDVMQADMERVIEAFLSLVPAAWWSP